MTRRRAYTIVAVALLVGLNVWRWWPAVAPGPAGTTPSEVVPTDLVLHARPDRAGAARPLRDLFYDKVPVTTAHRTRIGHPRSRAQPRIDPQELAAQTAQTELKQYQLAGVAFHNHKWQALVLRGQQTYTVAPGDTIDGRFDVTDITSRSLTLVDRQTKAMVFLHLSPN